MSLKIYMKSKLGAKLMSGIGATITEVRKELKSHCDELKNDGMYDMFVTFGALVIFVGTYGIHEVITKKSYNESSTDLIVIENECKLYKTEGKKSTYFCEVINEEQVSFEKAELYINKERCTPDLNNPKKINCYGIERDKITELEKNTKVNISCVRNKNSRKSKCYKR